MRRKQWPLKMNITTKYVLLKPHSISLFIEMSLQYWLVMSLLQICWAISKSLMSCLCPPTLPTTSSTPPRVLIYLVYMLKGGRTFLMYFLRGVKLFISSDQILKKKILTHDDDDGWFSDVVGALGAAGDTDLTQQTVESMVPQWSAAAQRSWPSFWGKRNFITERPDNHFHKYLTEEEKEEGVV